MRLFRWLRAARTLSIYCDGSAHGRAGLPGGWAFVVVSSRKTLLEDSGALRSSTSTGAELFAALAGLRAVLHRKWHHLYQVELVSDCRVALDAVNGAPGAGKEAGLTHQVRQAALEARAQARWVPAHSGHFWNEHVDALACRAKQSLVPRKALERLKRKRRATTQ